MLARAKFENNGPRGACRVHLKTRTFGGSATSDSEGHFPAAVPVMFTKDRDVMTYYAVRLRSRPKLLYLPESWAPVLTAYAAAKPFGGRIGPDITAPEINQSFEYQGYIDSVDGTPIAASNPLLGFPAFPNYAFYPGDDMGYGSAMRRTTLVDIISSRGADMRPEHGTNGGRADRYPGFFASGQTGIGNVIFDGNVTSPGDPRREILVALRGPNAFDAMMFSIFPTRHSGTSGVSNIDDQFPGGAYYSSQEGIHESGAGADLAPIVSHFSAPGRPLGTEIIYADDPANASFPFYDIHSQILAHDPPPFNRTDYRRLVSSWAPADEVASADAGIAKYSAAEGLFRPEPGWGRTGYSVKLISFSSIKTPTFFNNGSAHAAPAIPANSNLSFDGPGRRDPNIPEGPPRRGQVLH
jgi:hypothetical protein